MLTYYSEQQGPANQFSASHINHLRRHFTRMTTKKDVPITYTQWFFVQKPTILLVSFLWTFGSFLIMNFHYHIVVQLYEQSDFQLQSMRHRQIKKISSSKNKNCIRLSERALQIVSFVQAGTNSKYRLEFRKISTLAWRRTSVKSSYEYVNSGPILIS